MNPHPPQSPNALDAEERALAKGLPRLHGRTTPGPDLDASILAAAQAAVQPAKPVRANATLRIRWIAPTALAASMVLAVGMAWQLRPLPALHVPQPATAEVAPTEPAVRMIEPAPNDKTMPMAKVQPAVVQSQRANAVAARTEQARPKPDDQPAAAPDPPFPPPPAPPAPMTATPPAAALPAQPPAAMAAKASSSPAEIPTGALQTQALQDASHERATAAATANGMRREATADKAGVTTSVPSAAASPAPAVSRNGDARNEAEMAADAGFVDAPEADIPPATAASPAVRDAWLRRISQLLEQGNRQDAKASLAEFKRRYPNAVLPPALKALDSEP